MTRRADSVLFHARARSHISRPERDGQTVNVYDDLDRATSRWTLPVVIRTYKRDRDGEARMHEEVRLLSIKHYEPTTQSQDGGHVHAGRLIMTGGLSILAGRAGIRSKGDVTITFRKVATAAPSAPVNSPSEIPREDDPIAKLRALADMRERGLISETDYEAKKTELLSRL
jgi:hypothetical protein